MFKGNLGLLKMKQKLKCGKILSYAHATIHLPPDALEAVGIAVGDKYVVKRIGDRLFTIKKSRNVSCRVLAEAVAIKFTPTHKLGFAGNLCAIAAQDMRLTEVDFRLENDALISRCRTLLKLQLRKRHRSLAMQSVNAEKKRNRTSDGRK